MNPYLRFLSDAIFARYRKPRTPYVAVPASFKFSFCVPFFRYYITQWNARKIILFFGFHRDEQVDALFTDISDHFNAAPQSIRSYPAIDELLGPATLYEFHLPDCVIAVLAYRQGTREEMDARSDDAWDEIIRPRLKRMLRQPEFGVGKDIWLFWVDNDEWLYSPSPRNVLQRTRQLFHFLDLAPTSTMDRHEWSLQPMAIQQGHWFALSGKLIHTCKLFSPNGRAVHIYKPKCRNELLLYGRANCARFDALVPLGKEARQRQYEKLGNVCKCYHLPYLNLDEKLVAYARRLRENRDVRRYDEHILGFAEVLPWDKLTVSDDFLFRYLDAAFLQERMETMLKVLAQVSPPDPQSAIRLQALLPRKPGGS